MANWIAGLSLGVVLLGCNLEKDKCLERCKVDGNTQRAACETTDDPVTCKQKAEETQSQCVKTCNEAR